MKREDVAKIFENATDTQIDSILDINSADIGKAKSDYAAVKAELEKANGTIAALQGDIKTLQDSQASAEDWKTKFEALDRQINEDREKAETERKKAEKQAEVLNRFNAACVGSDGKPLEFAHEAIKADYLRKFGESLESGDYTGKSDADIFHLLTKDDAGAFKGVTAQVMLKGGNPLPKNDEDMARARAVMGLKNE